MKNLSHFRIIAINPKTLILDWQQEPSETFLEYLLSCKETFEKDHKIKSCVIGYQSLLIHLYEKIENLVRWKKYLQKLISSSQVNKKQKWMHWSIPLCYEVKYAPDLIPLAKTLKLEVNEVVRIHSKTRYRISFIGFLPGFLYLIGLNARLHHPRKEKPLLKVPKGSVGIGGKQTGIYPSSSPGGWHLIGTTPIDLFDTKKDPPCFAKAGDWISFDPINSETYMSIKEKIRLGKFKLESHD